MDRARHRRTSTSCRSKSSSLLSCTPAPLLPLHRRLMLLGLGGLGSRVSACWRGMDEGVSAMHDRAVSERGRGPSWMDARNRSIGRGVWIKSGCSTTLTSLFMPKLNRVLVWRAAGRPRQLETTISSSSATTSATYSRAHHDPTTPRTAPWRCSISTSRVRQAKSLSTQSDRLCCL